MAYSGTGTEADPYQVSTIQDFLTCARISGAYVKVISDIAQDLYSDDIQASVEIAARKIYADSLKKISNVRLSVNSSIAARLFQKPSGVTAVTCTVENLYFENLRFGNAYQTIQPRVFEFDTSSDQIIFQNCIFDINIIRTAKGNSISSGRVSLVNCWLKVNFTVYSSSGGSVGNMTDGYFSAYGTVFDISSLSPGTDNHLYILGTYEFCTLKIEYHFGSQHSMYNSYLFNADSHDNIAVISSDTEGMDVPFSVLGENNAADTENSDIGTFSGNSVHLLTQEQIQSESYLRQIGFISGSEQNPAWIFDNLFYGYPHVLNLNSNPVSLMFGSIPVQKAFLGSELIWERGGINKMITGNLIGSETA